ncbi:bifunctional pyr operon transcriptional regulator/uracil phosphoribosyltransferase PyrR [Thiomicrospira microaerophila]|uniref:bifunctional pyr operon transcriptional regulator/uracil phosphoribosyltransferase PyrR n=1 Tax=Thiomicrospira microaerophila TaxID=406020 RepID=UPI00200C8B9F|nr:bifunctional pyr operon transcriptional regulator/uracil phosphoribosyltransferase PyrR [Thiomicrospira microaerophila]UQB41700.1 bifunctional pyr operon transcriptional regulator/uracil phosphoribosyltransferase PyrR [Thiomicrospira microaerophila]
MTPLNQDVSTLIDELCEQIQKHPRFSPQIKMLGIRTGGEWIAQTLHRKLALTEPLGVLDSSFYRDDFSKVGLHPEVQPSVIPWELTDQHLFLVDDVLYTGRTTRAAMNELFDYGRPASITLVTLVDRRGCRELPIQPDITALKLECSQTLKLHGPDPLTLSLIEPAETEL